METTLTEQAWAGELGHVLVALSLATGLASAGFYLLGLRTSANPQNTRLGRWLFVGQSLSIFGIIALLFYMLSNHLFAYDYIWKHSNSEMPVRYILSAFWEGQEGSFLLWMFWHAILGLFIIRRRGSWEAPVMATVVLFQTALVTMILGIYVGDARIGSDPFILIRNLPENVGMPWTLNPNYLSLIPELQNGRGLNPLLQNYWMTIHPPTLFLGFASVLIPFAFALGGLMTGRLREWIKPALTWTYFAIAALGLGILMGGAWAYEALSFGGFWAWDPVENSSLVPWLTLVGAGHVMLVNLRKNNSLFTVYLLTGASFLLVLYSTFLTRSGVLGDTSVHSFTGDGLIGQLLIVVLLFTALTTGLLLLNRRLQLAYAIACALLLAVAYTTPDGVLTLVFFLALSGALLFISYRKFFPKQPEEEALWSREFWLFIGAITFLLSALQITFETSKPVFNLLAEPFASPLMALYDLTGVSGFKSLAEGKLAPHSDRIGLYNQWQIPFAFVITFLIAISQFLRYKSTPLRPYLRKLAVSFGAALVLTAVISYATHLYSESVLWNILLFTTLFALASNAHYGWQLWKGKWDTAGSAVAHIGFALILLGALISTGKSEKISNTTNGPDLTQLGEQFNNAEDILLFKDDTTQMNQYFIAYRNRYKEGVNVYFEVDYYSKQPRTYQQGEYIFYQGAVFRANTQHQASEQFLGDQQHWDFIKEPGEDEMRAMKAWTAYVPGDKLFTLDPHVQLNPTFGNVAEPSTKRYLDRDVYTHVKWAELEEAETDADGYQAAEEHVMQPGDTVFVGSYMMRLDSVVVATDAEKRDEFRLFETDLAVKAVVKVRNNEGEVWRAQPLFILRDNLVIPDFADIPDLGWRVAFSKIDPAKGEFTLQVARKPGNDREFIVMQAIVFPWINVLWLGSVLMVLGTVMAVRNRIRTNKLQRQKKYAV